MKKLILVACTVMFLGGCTQQTVSRPVAEPKAVPLEVQQPGNVVNTNVTRENNVSQWSTQEAGGVVTFEIPTGCIADGAAGSQYIACPTDENPTPTPEFVVSSDGMTVSFQRWEDLESPYYEHAISSIQVKTPLTHAITINIQE